MKLVTKYRMKTLAVCAWLCLAGCGSDPYASAPDAGPDGDAQTSSDTEDMDSNDLDTAPTPTPDPTPDASPEDTNVDDAPTEDAPDMQDDAAPDPEPEPTAQPKSLVIALDGVRPDALAHARTPRIDALIEGTWQPGYRGAYTPFAQNLYDAATVSGPNHVAIMTGAVGQQHGVTSNGDVGGGNYADFPHYLAQLEAALDVGTAYLFTWGTDALIPSGADYIKVEDDATNTQRAASIIEGSFEDPNGLLGQWGAGDDVDAIFLFLDDPDHKGHGHGFETNIPQYIEELESVDGQIGALMDAIANRPTFPAEHWQIVITSDHGGYHTSHGGYSGPEHTIPFLVASRDVSQGRLPAQTRIFDTIPTVLTHMGVEVSGDLRGQARGADAAPLTQRDINTDLVGYYRFEGDLTDASGRGNHAAPGEGADVEPELRAQGGRFGGMLSITDPGGGSGAASFITLGRPDDFAFGDDDAYSLTVWFRSSGQQGGDPVIIGNKDWVSGTNPGWLLLANEGFDDSFGANFASGEGERLDLEDVDRADNDWWFLAIVFDPDALATVYCGDASGRLRWMALGATGVGALTSPLPINIGQDGTGSYPHNLEGELDDLAIWRRTLSHEEILSLYGGGSGPELATLR